MDKISQNAKQNSVHLKKEIINSQMSVEAAMVEYAESEGGPHSNRNRGNSGIKNMLLGSIASGVVKYATCPVMVVK